MGAAHQPSPASQARSVPRQAARAEACKHCLKLWLWMIGRRQTGTPHTRKSRRSSTRGRSAAHNNSSRAQPETATRTLSRRPPAGRMRRSPHPPERTCTIHRQAPPRGRSKDEAASSTAHKTSHNLRFCQVTKVSHIPGPITQYMLASCCRSTLANLSRAAAKAAKDRLRRMGLLPDSPDWPRRAEICERCPMRVIVCNRSYCGRPFLQLPKRDPAVDGCGCPTLAKAKDASEHCPIDARSNPAHQEGDACNCKWCAAVAGASVGG